MAWKSVSSQQSGHRDALAEMGQEYAKASQGLIFITPTIGVGSVKTFVCQPTVCQYGSIGHGEKVGGGYESIFEIIRKSSGAFNSASRTNYSPKRGCGLPSRLGAMPLVQMSDKAANRICRILGYR